MSCVHLRQLYKLCEQHDLKLAGPDLIRVVCRQCGEQEVCPSTLTYEYDTKQPPPANDQTTSEQPQDAAK
jgi:hypothetical protein